MIEVAPGIHISEDELQESFMRASGPGGQNVNKLSTAVELRFDLARSPSLPERVRARLAVLAGRRLTQEGVLVVTAREHRTQERNRESARQKLFELIRRAAEPPPPPRRATKPTLGSRLRRLEGKSRRAGVKRGRGAPRREE
jgi:ribosome-associated protein